jgi:serine/threonine-protein kinase
MGTAGSTTAGRLGRYELLARIATGGMGEIFLARLEGAAGFEKLFVIKRILPHLADDARFRAMLIGEARIASQMSHANICQVYELGETDGQLYIVMEYLEGITLLPLLRKMSKENAPLDLGFVAGVIQQCTDALHYAHELRDRTGESMGIVHRDVTPSNVFLTEQGVAKILDFGIAKVKNANAHTQTGTVKGKYAYMAPEQLRGASVDRRADVFALGVVTYEMLALRRLFQRKTDYLTFRAVMEQPIPDVRRYRPDVPDALADALAKALDRDPDQRFLTARQLGSAVLDAIGKRPWTQGEISDYVKATFSDDIHQRSNEVASVIHRTKPEDAGRSTMPLLVTDDQTHADALDDDEQDFPSVESTLSDAPPLEVLRRQDGAAASGEFYGSTPPPFGGDASTSSGAALVPITTAQTAAKRSLLWPIVAIAGVAVAGVALFLVWQQMQKQNPPPVVNITASPAQTAPVPDLGSSPRPPDEPPPTPVGTPVKRPPKRPPASPYDIALQHQQTKINACAQEHGVPPGKARVVIVIATNGKAKQVSLEPASLNTTPLGACIKNVLSVATFPTAKDEMQVAVALTKAS